MRLVYPVISPPRGHYNLAATVPILLMDIKNGCPVLLSLDTPRNTLVLDGP